MSAQGVLETVCDLRTYVGKQLFFFHIATQADPDIIFIANRGKSESNIPSIRGTFSSIVAFAESRTKRRRRLRGEGNTRAEALRQVAAIGTRSVDEAAHALSQQHFYPANVFELFVHAERAARDIIAITQLRSLQVEAVRARLLGDRTLESVRARLCAWKHDQQQPADAHYYVRRVA